jgi:hypothetical protein
LTSHCRSCYGLTNRNINNKAGTLTAPGNCATDDNGGDGVSDEGVRRDDVTRL